MSTRKYAALDVNSNERSRRSTSFKRPMPEMITNDDLSYLYTFGREYTTIDGKEWIGEYHIRKGGLAFTGPVQSKTERDDSIALLPYYESQNNYAYDRLYNFVAKLKDHADPIPYEFAVREEEGEYEQGFTTRYFVQKIGIGTYAIEIDQEQRDRYASREGIDNRIYRLAAVIWRLTGTLQSIEEANKKAVSEASILIPDLPFNIRNYTQYARPTQQTVFPMQDSLLISRKTNISPEQQIPGTPISVKKLIDTKTPPPIKRTYDPQTGLITPPKPPF